MRIRLITGDEVADVAELDLKSTVAADRGLVWVDLDHSDEHAMALLPELFDVRSGDVDDCHLRTPVPKLHMYPDHHYTAINGLVRGSDQRLYFQPLKVFQNPRLVVTVLGPDSGPRRPWI